MSGEKFLEALSMMNHQFLTELCLNGDGKDEVHYATDFLDPHHIKSPNLLEYLEKCTKLKAQPTVGWSEKCRDQNILISVFKVNKHGLQKGKNLLNTLQN